MKLTARNRAGQRFYAFRLDNILELLALKTAAKQLSLCIAEFGGTSLYSGRCLCESCSEHWQMFEDALNAADGSEQFVMTSDPAQAHEFSDLVELAYALLELVESHNQLTDWRTE